MIRLLSAMMAFSRSARPATADIMNSGVKVFAACPGEPAAEDLDISDRL